MRTWMKLQWLLTQSWCFDLHNDQELTEMRMCMRAQLQGLNQAWPFNSDPNSNCIALETKLAHAVMSGMGLIWAEKNKTKTKQAQKKQNPDLERSRFGDTSRVCCVPPEATPSKLHYLAGWEWEHLACEHMVEPHGSCWHLLFLSVV